MQLFQLNPTPSIQSSLSQFELCLATFHSWFCYNGLALGSDYSEAITFGTQHKLCNYPLLPGFSIAGTMVLLTDKIKTLGVTFDSHLTLNSNTSSVCYIAFDHI
jgi:hypothetical protein